MKFNKIVRNSHGIDRNLGKFTSSIGDPDDDHHDHDEDEDNDEVYLKCRGVEKNVGRLGDVRGMHTVVVRDVLVKIILRSCQKMIECVL